ncbi:MAG TPA: hypothetical protein VKY65_06865 [Alphaproteobacteria bacterium]|nr:hypothetical protein [Alphaproteobacteria bacterium]
MPTDNPLVKTSRLAGLKGDGRSAYLSEKGAFLGRGTPLLELRRDATDRSCWQPRPLEELERVLSAGYGVPIDLGSRMGALDAVARALSAGDAARAAVALLHARLPPLPGPAAARRLAEADRLAKYSPSQTRIPKGQAGGGRWTRDGEDDADGTAHRDANALLQDIAYTLPPKEAELAKKLFALLKESPIDLAALWDALKAERLDFDNLHAVLKSAFDPPRTLAELQTARPPQGFTSWAALQDYLEPAPPGYEWHHIIEQAQTRPDLTSSEGRRKWIQNTENVVLIPVLKHMLISGYMSSVITKNGLRYRDAIRLHDPDIQREIGLGLLRRFGVLK